MTHDAADWLIRETRESEENASRMLAELRSWAGECGCEASVVTFDRHPQAVLGGPPVEHGLHSALVAAHLGLAMLLLALLALSIAPGVGLAQPDARPVSLGQAGEEFGEEL